MQILEKVQNCKNIISRLLPASFRPQTGLILGTGLGGLAGEVKRVAEVNYADLPGYPASTVASHSGRFSFGQLNGVPVALQEGRCHLYEGYTPGEVVMGVRVMAALGVQSLIVTNAAGAVNPTFQPGRCMLIRDHINFTAQSPLAGLGEVEGLERFPDMSRPYDPEYLELAEQAALELGEPMHQGVYLGLLGPQLETLAETRMFRAWGADAVGMSTVQEVIAARHLRLRVLGLSALSNINLPDCPKETGLAEIIETSALAGAAMARIIRALLPRL